MNIAQVTQRTMLTIIMSVVAAVLLFPIVITLTNSFMTAQESRINYGEIGQLQLSAAQGPNLFANMKLLPDQVTLTQYRQVLVDSPRFLNMFWNSVLLVIPIIAGQAFVAAFAAYAFSKLRFPGQDRWFLVYVMTMLMPFQVTLVPNYLMADKLGMLNSPNAIIWPGIFSAFGVFMLRQFMLHIPYAYIEAAKIDGAGHLRTFFTVIFPMVKSGLAAMIVLLFVDYWNMVEQPLVFLDDPLRQPLSVYLSRIGDEPGIAFAASVLYMAPMVLLFLYAETYFIQGVQLSGIKG